MEEGNGRGGGRLGRLFVCVLLAKVHHHHHHHHIMKGAQVLRPNFLLGKGKGEAEFSGFEMYPPVKGLMKGWMVWRALVYK